MQNTNAVVSKLGKTQGQLYSPKQAYFKEPKLGLTNTSNG